MIQARETQVECTKIPKRLRGEIIGLLRELLVRYRRIDVEQLAGHYLRLEQVSVDATAANVRIR
jgi:hypothetical protein